MTGTTVPAATTPSTSLAGMNVGMRQQPTASEVNFLRLSTVVQRLATHIQSGRLSQPAEFAGLCLSLARGIDFAVANNEIPTKTQELSFLLKQICQCRNDLFLQAAIMVLMISVKNACKLGWFPEKESQELFALANEIGRAFGNLADVSTSGSYPVSTISTILARFYPFMKMGQILAFLEAKPGFGAHVIDFHISKSTPHSPQDKIRLFVAKTDNMETSACIINPQKVSILLNGKGVDKRTSTLMDTGPQMPTNITSMLKYGTNLLQAIGHFNGHHIIIVAFMSMTSSCDPPSLQDYVQSDTAEPDSDSDIIEGPSRISLSCPISHSRIKIPVKGHSCKHLQCFDFSNYIDINTRRPSWRCPHCNQHVCYTDIRVDQNIVQVLKEVGDNVADVVISADGSWKAVLESDNCVDHVHDKTLDYQNDGSDHQEPVDSSNAVPLILDLTGDEMNVDGPYEVEDRKPPLTHLEIQSNATSLAMPSNLNCTAGNNQNVAAQIENDFWSRANFTHDLVTSSARSNIQVNYPISESASPNFMTSPVLTDAISPALNREADICGNSSLVHNQFSAPRNMQLQQSQQMNQTSQEYGRAPSIPRHVTRVPIAVQALPAPSQIQTPQQRSGSTMTILLPNGSSLPSQPSPLAIPAVDGFNRMSGDMERQQQFTRSHMHGPQVSAMGSSSLQHHSVAQNLDPHWLPQSRGHSPGFRAPSPLPRPLMQPMFGHRTGAGNSQQDRFVAGAQRAVQLGRQAPTVPVQIQTSRGPSYPVNADGIRAPSGEQRGNIGGMLTAVSRADLPSEQTWRPPGRMRGSLLPGAYSAALDPLIIRPTQSAQATRPPVQSPPASGPSITPFQLPTHLQMMLLTNNSMTESASGAVAPGLLPEQSPGMR